MPNSLSNVLPKSELIRCITKDFSFLETIQRVCIDTDLVFTGEIDNLCHQGLDSLVRAVVTDSAALVVHRTRTSLQLR